MMCIYIYIHVYLYLYVYVCPYMYISTDVMYFRIHVIERKRRCVHIKTIRSHHHRHHGHHQTDDISFSHTDHVIHDHSLDSA